MTYKPLMIQLVQSIYIPWITMHFPQCEIVTQPMIALAACWHCFPATTVNRYMLMALTAFAANINTARYWSAYQNNASN